MSIKLTSAQASATPSTAQPTTSTTQPSLEQRTAAVATAERSSSYNSSELLRGLSQEPAESSSSSEDSKAAASFAAAMGLSSAVKNLTAKYSSKDDSFTLYDENGSEWMLTFDSSQDDSLPPLKVELGTGGNKTWYLATLTNDANESYQAAVSNIIERPRNYGVNGQYNRTIGATKSAADLVHNLIPCAYAVPNHSATFSKSRRRVSPDSIIPEAKLRNPTILVAKLCNQETTPASELYFETPASQDTPHAGSPDKNYLRNFLGLVNSLLELYQFHSTNRCYPATHDDVKTSNYVVETRTKPGIDKPYSHLMLADHDGGAVTKKWCKAGGINRQAQDIHALNLMFIKSLHAMREAEELFKGTPNPFKGLVILEPLNNPYDLDDATIKAVLKEMDTYLEHNKHTLDEQHANVAQCATSVIRHLIRAVNFTSDRETPITAQEEAISFLIGAQEIILDEIRKGLPAGTMLGITGSPEYGAAAASPAVMGLPSSSRKRNLGAIGGGQAKASPVSKAKALAKATAPFTPPRKKR